MNMICQITVKNSNGSRFIKGEKYVVLPMIGLPNVKLFEILHPNGDSIKTDEAHLNKFFKK